MNLGKKFFAPFLAQSSITDFWLKPKLFLCNFSKRKIFHSEVSSSASWKNKVAHQKSGPSRKGGRGGKRSRARAPRGPVTILCHTILLLLYISAMHFYGN